MPDIVYRGEDRHQPGTTAGQNRQDGANKVPSVVSYVKITGADLLMEESCGPGVEGWGVPSRTRLRPRTESKSGPLGDELGRYAGVLLGRTRQADVIDAAVAPAAHDGDDIVTSDTDALCPMAEATGRHVELVRPRTRAGPPAEVCFPEMLPASPAPQAARCRLDVRGLK